MPVDIIPLDTFYHFLITTLHIPFLLPYLFDLLHLAQTQISPFLLIFHSPFPILLYPVLCRDYTPGNRQPYSETAFSFLVLSGLCIHPFFWKYDIILYISQLG